MDNEDRQYGRKRTKKPKLSITPQPHSEQPAEITPTLPAPKEQIQEQPDLMVAPEFPLLEIAPPAVEPPEPKAESGPEIRETEETPVEVQKEPIVEKEQEPVIEKPQPRREQRRPERRERPERNERFRPDRHQERSTERPIERPPLEKRRDNLPSQRPIDKPQRRFSPERGKVRVSIIIPAYNEEGNIKPLLDQFHEVIARTGNDWEVILVNDGSTDKTAERARDASIHYHWLRVVSYSKNRGLTAALETGFQNAKGLIYVFYPADLQYHPQDIPKMINRIDRGADLVTGWKQGNYQKKFVSFVYNRLCQSLFHLKVHDLNSVKAFKKEVLEKLKLRRDWHRYMVVLAAEEGFIIDEVKVNVYPRHTGKSKFGTGRILGGVLDLLSVKFQISFTKKPLRFFGMWGIFSILLGILTGLVAIYLRFFTPHGSRVWLYLVILFVLSGLMLFSLGFLAEVIVALREDIESLIKKK
jgi:glycosyltransferase involved in cell wall biosynthesis